MAKNRRYSLVIAIVATIITVIVLISACNLLDFGGSDQSAQLPANTSIITPANNARVLVGSPVQIQSAFANEAVVQVELAVKGPRDEIAQLLRIDAPRNGRVLQQWIPDQVGMYTIQLTPFDSSNTALEPLTQQVEVVEDLVVSAQEFIEPEPAISPPPQEEAPGDDSAAFQSPSTSTPPPPTATPLVLLPPDEFIGSIEVIPATPEVIGIAGGDAEALVYPPPPPVPGVPYGPTQDELPLLMPPVCDAAKYLGPFVPNTSERISITEKDGIPAKTVGGTLVHRAWRLQNIGTCTWGPGYELAFYGGRSMGSGGVVFETFFPDEPDRRNLVGNPDRIIAPEGKPNQVAVLEVLLQAPVTPGIHQSYWRMRNPQGVYFGPIFGVTLEIVRDCQFNIYGAPVVNRFEILGVGDVFRPEDPINVRAELGQPVTLDWSVINAENYDIVVRDPVGGATNLSTNNRTDRNSFTPTRLGEYDITLYADNGPCTATAQVFIDVVPNTGNTDFNLIIFNAGASSAASTADAGLRTSPSVQAGDVKVEWQHANPDANQFTLQSGLFERRATKQCRDFLGIIERCSRTIGNWELVQPPISINVGGEVQGAANITNLVKRITQPINEDDPNVEDYQIRYVMYARNNGSAVEPSCSNTVIDNDPKKIEPDQNLQLELPAGPGDRTVNLPCLTTTSEPDKVVSCEGGLTILGNCFYWNELILIGLAGLVFILILRVLL